MDVRVLKQHILCFKYGVCVCREYSKQCINKLITDDVNHVYFGTL